MVGEEEVVTKSDLGPASLCIQTAVLNNCSLNLYPSNCGSNRQECPTVAVTPVCKGF